jgi:hypothetical protein
MGRGTGARVPAPVRRRRSRHDSPRRAPVRTVPHDARPRRSCRTVGTMVASRRARLEFPRWGAAPHRQADRGLPGPLGDRAVASGLQRDDRRTRSERGPRSRPRVTPGSPPNASGRPTAPLVVETLVHPPRALRHRPARPRPRLAGEDEPDGVAIDQRSFDSVWAAGVAARPATKAHWIHGNLDPRYIMSDRGKFAGISTWFTFSAGDPAADIGAACVALPVEAEEEFLEGYGDLDAASRDRACAFRLLACVEYATSSNPFLRRIGWQRLAELQSERRSDLRRHA